jgi:hypothetical protein
MSTTSHTPTADDNDPDRLYDWARFLYAQALDNGWTVSPTHSEAAGHFGFVATDIPRGIQIQTELTRDGLRSWRLEHRTQTKVSDQVVAWFEQH